MGPEHLTEGTLAALAERRLPTDRVADALRHLEACAACRARATTHAGNIGGLRDAFGGDNEDHLDDADLIAYVDGVARPDQIEIVETHVEDCALCRAQLDDLLALRAPARRASARPVRWIAIAASLFIALVLLGIFVTTREEPRALPRVTAAPATTPTAPARGRGGLKPRPTSDEHPEWTRLVSDAVSSEQLPFAAVLATLTGEADELRGTSPERIDRVAPAGVVVDTTRPEFSWPARGESFVVLVFDGETEVVRSKALADARWKPARDLERGRTYTWQVEVANGGETDYIPTPPAPPAMFHIAGEEEHRAIDEALRARPDDHLLHAVLYARAGLRAEALASLRRAGNDPDARKLLVKYEKP